MSIPKTGKQRRIWSEFFVVLGFPFQLYTSTLALKISLWRFVFENPKGALQVFVVVFVFALFAVIYLRASLLKCPSCESRMPFVCIPQLQNIMADTVVAVFFCCFCLLSLSAASALARPKQSIYLTFFAAENRKTASPTVAFVVVLIIFALAASALRPQSDPRM